MIFCPNFSNKKVKQEFDELVSLFGEDGAYLLWDRSNGNGLELAPNGASSQLFETLLDYHNGDRRLALLDKAKLYTNSFTSKYGNWYRSADQYKGNLDLNGEPILRLPKQFDDSLFLQRYNKEESFEDYRRSLIKQIAARFVVRNNNRVVDNSRKIDPKDMKWVLDWIKNKNDETLWTNENINYNAKLSISNILRDRGILLTYHIISFETKKGKKGYRVEYSIVENKAPQEKIEITRREIELAEHIVDRVIDNMNDDDFDLNTADLNVFFHINPKKLEELKRQTIKKAVLSQAKDIEEAFLFLVDLENNQENNAYVDTCIRWLKNDVISLPRDNEKIRPLFDYARQHNLDIQQFKEPLDIIKHQIKGKVLDVSRLSADMSKREQFKLNRVVEVNGLTIEVYDVEDSPEGQLAVALLLNDTAPVDSENNPIVFSPWCLSTYHRDSSTGKVSMTSSAKNYWGRYSKGKRQIAIHNGAPVAFNSSSSERDEWWDFYDGSKNGYSGWLSVEEIDLNSPALVYSKGQSNREYIYYGNWTVIVDNEVVNCRMYDDNNIDYYSTASYCTYSSKSCIEIRHNDDYFSIGPIKNNNYFGSYFDSLEARFRIEIINYVLKTVQYSNIHHEKPDLEDFKREITFNLRKRDFEFYSNNIFRGRYSPKDIQIQIDLSEISQIINKFKNSIFKFDPSSHISNKSLNDFNNQLAIATEHLVKSIGELLPTLNYKEIYKYIDQPDVMEDQNEEPDEYDELPFDTPETIGISPFEQELIELDQLLDILNQIEEDIDNYLNENANPNPLEQAQVGDQLNPPAVPLNEYENENYVSEQAPTPPVISEPVREAVSEVIRQRMRPVRTPNREYGSNEYDVQQEYNIGGEYAIGEYALPADPMLTAIEQAEENLKKQIEKQDLAAKYLEYIEKPINKELEKLLTDILKKYHFEIIEGDIQDMAGQQGAIAAFDYLLKLIYLAKEGDRNLITYPEEFSHAFIKMMGAVYHREENRHKYPETALFSKLRDLIVQTDFYQDVYERYKDSPLYKFKNGSVNTPKIAEEALGQALAVYIADEYERYTKDKGFFNKLKKWFKQVLSTIKSWFTDKNGTTAPMDQLNDELNKIAKSIIDGSYYNKYLKKLNRSNMRKVTFEDTIEKDRVENQGRGLEKMRFFSQIGGVVTGSISYRAQGDTYRSDIELLHDIDVCVPLSVHLLHIGQPALSRFKNGYTQEHLINAILRTKGANDFVTKMLEHYPNMSLIAVYSTGGNVISNWIECENQELAEKFKSMEGNFNSRMARLTQEERDLITLVDLFFNGSEEALEGAVEKDGVNLTHYAVSFEKKLAMSRAKDLDDYQQWKPYRRDPRYVPNARFLLKVYTNNLTDADVSTISEDLLKVGEDRMLECGW